MKEHYPSHANVVLINHRAKSITRTNPAVIANRAIQAILRWLSLERVSKYFITHIFD